MYKYIINSEFLCCDKSKTLKLEETFKMGPISLKQEQEDRIKAEVEIIEGDEKKALEKAKEELNSALNSIILAKDVPLQLIKQPEITFKESEREISVYLKLSGKTHVKVISPLSSSDRIEINKIYEVLKLLKKERDVSEELMEGQLSGTA